MERTEPMNKDRVKDYMAGVHHEMNQQKDSEATKEVAATNAVLGAKQGTSNRPVQSIWTTILPTPMEGE